MKKNHPAIEIRLNWFTSLPEKISQCNILLAVCWLCFIPEYSAAAPQPPANLQSIQITDSGGTNQPPIAKISYAIIADGAVNFNGGGSADTDGSISAYKWDFGDGTSATGVTASHQYTTWGDFPVVLTTVDDKGGVGITQLTYTRTQSLEKVGFQELLQDRSGASRAGFPVAVKVVGVPSHNGTLLSISAGLKGNGVARPFRLALYTDLNGKPGTLVPGAITVEKSTSANSFEVLELPIEQGAPQVQLGQQYWIVIETTGTYLFYSDKWVATGQISQKNNVASYNWPAWQEGTAAQAVNSQMGACFFTYAY